MSTLAEMYQRVEDGTHHTTEAIRNEVRETLRLILAAAKQIDASCVAFESSDQGDWMFEPIFLDEHGDVIDSPLDDEWSVGAHLYWSARWHWQDAELASTDHKRGQYFLDVPKLEETVMGWGNE